MQHRLASADALQDGVGTHPIGQFLDAGNALLTPLGHDVGGPESAGQLLARLVLTHGDHSLGAQLGRRQHPA